MDTFQWFSVNQDAIIFIQEIEFQNTFCKMATILFRRRYAKVIDENMWPLVVAWGKWRDEVCRTWPLFLIWFNFNDSMDNELHPL